MRFYLWVMVVGLAASCAGSDAAPVNYSLQGGGTLGDYAAGSAYVVAVVIEPSDIFNCGTSIGRWLEWGRRNPGQFVLVFTRNPDEGEQKRLLLHRIRPDEVLAEDQQLGIDGAPYQYVLASRQIVVSEPLPAGIPESKLLIAFETGRISELLETRRAVVQPKA